MRMTARKRDTPEGGGSPLRFRPSFFLLFEQSAGLKSSKPGLLDDIEKVTCVMNGFCPCLSCFGCELASIYAHVDWSRGLEIRLVE